MQYEQILQKHNVKTHPEYDDMEWNGIVISRDRLDKYDFVRVMSKIMFMDAYPNLEENDIDLLNNRPPIPRKEYPVVDDSGKDTYLNTPRTGDILQDFDFSSKTFDHQNFILQYSHSNIFYSIFRSLIKEHCLTHKELKHILPQCFFSTIGKEIMESILSNTDIRELTLYVIQLLNQQIPTAYVFISRFLDIYSNDPVIHSITNRDDYYLLTAGLNWCDFAHNYMWSESREHFDIIPRIIDSFKKTDGAKYLVLSKQPYYPVLLKILNYSEDLANFVVEKGNMNTFDGKKVFSILLDYMSILGQKKFISQVEFFKRLGFVPTEKEQALIDKMSGNFTHWEFVKMREKHFAVPKYTANEVFVLLNDFQDPNIVEKLSNVSCKALKEARSLFSEDEIRHTYFEQVVDHSPQLRQWYIDNIENFNSFNEPWFNRPNEKYRQKYMKMILGKRSAQEIVKTFKNEISDIISVGTLEIYVVLNVLKTCVADFKPLCEEVGKQMYEHKIQRFQKYCTPV